VNTHEKRLFLVVILLFPLLVWAGEQAKTQSRESPATEEEIVLTDFEGNRRTIGEFAGNGKWLVVMIWASDCHICNTEVPEYMAFHETHKDKDASVLGISMDGESGKKEAMAFLDRHLVNFPSLIGETAAVTALYGQLTGSFLAGTPAFLIYAPSGELAAKQIGAVPVPLIEEFMAANSKAASKG
jgi:peroxiredoxin